MKKSLFLCSIFQEISVPAKVTTPFSRIITAAMPSMPRCSEMPSSPRMPTFCSHVQLQLRVELHRIARLEGDEDVERDGEQRGADQRGEHAHDVLAFARYEDDRESREQRYRDQRQ